MRYARNEIDIESYITLRPDCNGLIEESKLEEEKKLSENNALLLKAQEDLKKERKKRRKMKNYRKN